MGVLAHSTHLRGAGTYDERTGEEHDRVTVTLATGIPEDRVRAVNLDYLDPAEVNPEAWAHDPDTLVVPTPARTSSGSAEPSTPGRPAPREGHQAVASCAIRRPAG